MSLRRRSNYRRTSRRAPSWRNESPAKGNLRRIKSRDVASRGGQLGARRPRRPSHLFRLLSLPESFPVPWESRQCFSVRPSSHPILLDHSPGLATLTLLTKIQHFILSTKKIFDKGTKKNFDDKLHNWKICIKFNTCYVFKLNLVHLNFYVNLTQDDMLECNINMT